MPAVLVAVSLALLAALAMPMFTSQVYVGDDLGAFHLPLRAFYAEQLQAGESFDWWPQLFAGFYATGEGQLGGYHPLHLALYKNLPLSMAFNLEVFLSYPFMLLGMFFWLRRLFHRATPALFGAPALFGSIIFTFSGFNLLHLFHVNAIAVVAHIPWLLLAIDVALRTNSRRSAAWAWLALAMLTGSQLLLGYPQYVWFSLLAEMGYVGYVLATQRPRLPTLVSLASAKATGLLLGGLQLLPTYDALQHSVRHSAGAGFAETYSLHPLNLVQLVAPYLFETRVVGENTHALGLYAGAVPLMLVVYLIVERRHLGRLRPIAIAATCLGVFAILMALGQFGVLYRLQAWLPVVGNFRAPCRMIVLFHLSTAVLSAVALLHLVRRPRQRERTGKSIVPYAAIVVLSLAMLPVAMVCWPEYLASVPHMLAGPALIAIAAVLVALSARRSQMALIALVVFCAVDLGVYGMSYSLWSRTAPLEQFVADAALPTPNQDTPNHNTPDSETSARVVRHLPKDGSPVRVGNLITLAGFDRIHGYAGLQPARRLDYRDAQALQVAGASWAHRDVAVQSNHDLQRTKPNADAAADFTPLQLPPLPRFRLVTEAHVSTSPAHDIVNLNTTTTALVDEPLELVASMSGTVRVASDSPGAMTLLTDAPTRQLLVTNEAYHHGWRMLVDGQPVLPIRVNGDFLGGVIPAGQHQVTLQFSPRSLRWGRLASSCGLGLMWVSFLLIRFRRGHQKPTQADAKTSNA